VVAPAWETGEGGGGTKTKREKISPYPDVLIRGVRETRKVLRMFPKARIHVLKRDTTGGEKKKNRNADQTVSGREKRVQYETILWKWNCTTTKERKGVEREPFACGGTNLLE